MYEASSSCYKSIADFVTAFYQGALSRNPTSPELVQWTMTLSQAQARGHGHLIAAAQSLGTTIFTSTEYTTLNTSNGQFVTDLYDAYLQRTPDSGGYNAWVAALATNSRTVVRDGFAYSGEFQSNVVQLCASTSTSASLKYVLTDEKGSARVLMENNGTSSAILARHDYLPFGEEIWAGVGLRTTTQKYSNTDKVRQRYGMTERDETTGLDHTWFRKYESMSGRWTSPDALGGSIANPQSFNRYAYVGNDPINFIDPLGLDKSGNTPGSGGKDGEVPEDITGWVNIFAGDTGVVIESGPTIGGGPGGPSLGPEPIPGGGPGSGGPQNPVNNATPDQQHRFNDALEELLRRLRANGGKNPCADFFGGIKKAEEWLSKKKTNFAFGPTHPDADAETSGNTVTINPNGQFMGTAGLVNVEINASRDFVQLTNVEFAAFALAHELGHRSSNRTFGCVVSVSLSGHLIAWFL